MKEICDVCLNQHLHYTNRCELGRVTIQTLARYKIDRVVNNGSDVNQSKVFFNHA